MAEDVSPRRQSFYSRYVRLLNRKATFAPKSMLVITGRHPQEDKSEAAIRFACRRSVCPPDPPGQNSQLSPRSLRGSAIAGSRVWQP